MSAWLFLAAFMLLFSAVLAGRAARAAREAREVHAMALRMYELASTRLKMSTAIERHLAKGQDPRFEELRSEWDRVISLKVK